MNRFTVKTKVLNALFLFKKSWSGIVQLIAVVGLLVLLSDCGSTYSPQEEAPPQLVSSFSSDVANQWFLLATNLVMTPGLNPGPARPARAFGYEGVALYEALVAGMPGYQSLAGQLNGLTEGLQVSPGRQYHWPSVANAALARVMNALYDVIPNGMSNTTTVRDAAQAQIQALYDQFAAQFQTEISVEAFRQSDDYGDAVGQHIVDWSNTDGFSTRSKAYTPCGDPSCWQETPPGLGAAYEPHWGDLRTFALTSGSEVDPGPPPTYDEDPASAFYAYALQDYNTVNNLTLNQQNIANYWADGPGTITPPGHSISMTRQILQQQEKQGKGFKLETAAEAYARVGIAAADAFIACWNTKYKYNLLRPITYIRKVDIDPVWLSFLATPNFPTYTSGHSTQSGAWARVMTDMFGNIPFTDLTNDYQGLAPRSFNTFAAVAAEAAVSRLYAGIHYDFDNFTGLTQGDNVGAKVSALHFRK